MKGWPFLFLSLLALGLSAVGCGEDNAVAAGLDASTAQDTHAAVDAGDTATETTTVDSESATTEPVPLPLAGEPCWNEDVFGTEHPNAGLADCAAGLRCVGNSSEASCTTLCNETGALNHSDAGLLGWCCGEITDPCSHQRYWLPKTLEFYCIPRTASLGKSCDRTSAWTGSNQRCAPLCDGPKLNANTECAPVTGSNDQGLCTLPCDPLANGADCAIESAFADGCCAALMNGYYCLPATLCP